VRRDPGPRDIDQMGELGTDSARRWGRPSTIKVGSSTDRRP
jgi:hypothetical protein